MIADVIPLNERRVSMREGGGGPAMRVLIEELFLKGFADPSSDGIGLSAMDDGAVLRVGDRWLVITTDSHVIHPIFFPGGDIGKLSISGTVNDLAMMGAVEPLGLTSAIILEEGFPIGELETIQRSMVETCREAGTTVVTGDTKVMGRGEIDKIVFNTTGVGVADRVIRDNGLQEGDRIIVTGTVGDHGLAIMSLRHGLGLEGELVSDVAPINGLIRKALDATTDEIVAMKDPTRGGVASALHEMAAKSKVGIVIEEGAVPITDAVRSSGELLGIDPLHVANEGKALIGVRAEAAERVLDTLRSHPLGGNASIIGTCISERQGSVIIDTGFGRRLLSEPVGEPLPRIC
ncbi:MAG: hydrogenase expression/formation protein HypE [Thermoanaerobaculia bacterium]|nr:hydrogenase expression/formation protein HypE [Thermoanaerobaculia bacterium]